jgi:hypothetical protein
LCKPPIDIIGDDGDNDEMGSNDLLVMKTTFVIKLRKW